MFNGFLTALGSLIYAASPVGCIRPSILKDKWPADAVRTA